MIFPVQNAAAQNIYGVVIQADENYAPTTANRSASTPLNDILNYFNVETYEQAYPVAKSSLAKNCFRIVLNGSHGDYADLENMLVQSEMFPEVLVEKDVPLDCDDPVAINDPGIQLPAGYYIENANLPCAWSITQGDPSVVVAIVDIYLDNGHDDLQGQIVDIQLTNPANSNCNHGFATTGALAAIPNNGICAAGSGYLTKVAFYGDPGVSSSCNSIYPTPGILKAYADGQKILSASFSGLGVAALWCKKW
jgi:hypothetical protein